MKSFIKKGITLLLPILFFSVQFSYAQCAMCSLTAQAATENGNSQGFGLNDGILFLLAMPYLAVLLVGLLWYRKYRRKQVVGTQQH